MTKIKSVQQFIEQHGNNFHSQVVQSFRTNDWKVIVSPFYRDNATDKAREVDIIAEKYIKVSNGFNQTPGYLQFRLIIECKYLKDQTVVWFDLKDILATEQRIIKDINLFQPFRNDITIQNHHWFTPDKAGKLYATNNNKQMESEMLFLATDKLLNCLVYYRNGRDIAPLDDKEKYKKENLLYPSVICYPLIVLNDFSSLFKTDISDSKISLERLDAENYFQLEVNYAYNRGIFSGTKVSSAEYFLIDVIHLDSIKNYLEMIKKDVKAISVLIEQSNKK